MRLPDGLGVWGIDSGIRHAVTGADYGAVRIGAFMGYRILAELAGLRVTAGDRKGHVHIDDPRWRGYLANVGGEAFRRVEETSPRLWMAGVPRAYGGTTDPVTSVDPACRYAIRTPTAHPDLRARARDRMGAPVDVCSRADGPPDAARLGALMYESHASYSACGLGSDGTDRLVALAREAGSARGIHGAKITGGGSGGTVAFLADASAGDTIRTMAREYAARAGARLTCSKAHLRAQPASGRFVSIRLNRG